MTQEKQYQANGIEIKRYAIGRYNSNGEPVKRTRIVTKPYMTKKRKLIEKREEVRAGIAYMLACFLIVGFYAAFSATNNIVLDVEAEGVEVADVVVETDTPEDYSGIPYMDRVEPEDFTENIWKSIGTMEISAYSEKDSCHYPTEGGCLVASGKVAKVGMVATNLYPFGTRLLIDGEVYIVEDRIAKRYGNTRIDIFVGYGDEAHENAIKWGIKKLEVKVLDNLKYDKENL